MSEYHEQICRQERESYEAAQIVHHNTKKTEKRLRWEQKNRKEKRK